MMEEILEKDQIEAARQKLADKQKQAELRREEMLKKRKKKPKADLAATSYTLPVADMAGADDTFSVLDIASAADILPEPDMKGTAVTDTENKVMPYQNEFYRFCLRFLWF